MKRLFLLLLLSITFACPYVFAEDEELPPPPPPSDDPTTPPAVVNPPIFIPINPPGSGNGDEQNPRTQSPISGMYIDEVVELYFIADMGAVSVTVLSDTGDVWYIDGDSRDYLLTIPITPRAGAYTITISTQSAGLFTGKFNL